MNIHNNIIHIAALIKGRYICSSNNFFSFVDQFPPSKQTIEQWDGGLSLRYFLYQILRYKHFKYNSTSMILGKGLTRELGLLIHSCSSLAEL